MSEYSQALKETTKYLNPPVGFVEGDMNENNLITYIAPDLMMPIKEFIEKMMPFKMILCPACMMCCMILVLAGIISFKNIEQPFGKLVCDLLQR